MASPPYCVHQFLVSHEFGGAAEIALQLAKRTLSDGHYQSLVWVPGEGRAAMQVRERHLPLSFYDSEAMMSKTRIRSRLASINVGLRLRSMGKGLLHIHSPFTYGALKLGMWVTNLRRIVHVHLDLNGSGMRWAFSSPPELIITCAKYMIPQVRAALPERFSEKTRIAAVPNAVDSKVFCPGNRLAARQAVGAPVSRPLLLMLANLAPHKGQATAIRAVRRLIDRGLDVQLWLAGVDRSPEREFERALHKQIADLRLGERVELLGFRSDAPELLRAADIVLLPSTSEGLPLSLLEAQASEVPVIAAPTAGVPEIISDGETGFLVSAEDDALYAARIEQLLGNSDLRRQIIERAARQCRQNHSWDAYYGRVTELYASLSS
jgi:glycosyltransferase involved in cell wall biosynthesis